MSQQEMPEHRPLDVEVGPAAVLLTGGTIQKGEYICFRSNIPAEQYSFVAEGNNTYWQFANVEELIFNVEGNTDDDDSEPWLLIDANGEEREARFAANRANSSAARKAAMEARNVLIKKLLSEHRERMKNDPNWYTR